MILSIIFDCKPKTKRCGFFCHNPRRTHTNFNSGLAFFVAITPGYGTTPSKDNTFAFVSSTKANKRSRKYMSHFSRLIHMRSLPGIYSQRIPMNAGTSAMPPAMETIIGFATSLRARAIALARARCPIPTPLLVARMIVGFSICTNYSKKNVVVDPQRSLLMIERQP